MYSVGPPSADLRYTIQISFRLRAGDDQFLDVYWDLYALGGTYRLSVYRAHMCYSIRVLVVMGATPGVNCYSIRLVRGVTVNIYNHILHVSCHASDFRSVIFIRRGVYPSDLII